MDRFAVEYRIALNGRLKNMRPSLNFYFKEPNSKGKQVPKLIFVDDLRTFELNYELDEINVTNHLN